jgi:hypothetical protein
VRPRLFSEDPPQDFVEEDDMHAPDLLVDLLPAHDARR